MARIDQRQQILEAATELFSEAGYTGTTMRDIGKKVGVLPGSLYAHIDSKEDLLVEIVESGIDDFVKAGESAARESGELPEDRLRSAIEAHIRVVAENKERTLVVFHQWRFLTGPNRQRIIEKRARYERIFSDIFDAGVESGTFDPELDRRLAILTVLGALNWSAEWLSADGRASVVEVGEGVSDSLIGGLKG